MSLESILNYILAKADSEKQGIIREAKREADNIIREAKREAQELYQIIINQAKADCERHKQRLIVNARLEARNNLLKIKQELIDALIERLKPGLGKERLKGRRVFLDSEQDISEDANFYLDKIRLDYESEIARQLF